RFGGVEHGPVDLADTVAVDTLAVCDPGARRRILPETVQKAIDQRGLADSRLAGDEDDLALAGGCQGVAALELGNRVCTTDESAGVLLERVRQGRCRRADPAKAAAVHRRDEARLLRIVAERLS